MSVELQHKKQEICELKSQQKSTSITHQSLKTTFEQEIRDLKSQISEVKQTCSGCFGMSVELQHKKKEICDLKSQQKSSSITHQGVCTQFEQEIQDLKSQISSNLIAHQLSMAKELELTYIGLLHRAAEYNNVQIYRDYITANLPYLKDTNPKDESGITPLHRAAIRGHLSMCQLILKSLAEVFYSVKK